MSDDLPMPPFANDEDDRAKSGQSYKTYIQRLEPEAQQRVMVNIIVAAAIPELRRILEMIKKIK
jgi:hypothetical protein